MRKRYLFLISKSLCGNGPYYQVEMEEVAQAIESEQEEFHEQECVFGRPEARL